MNFHFFAIKRTFHGVLRVSRDVAAGFGLTPARVDMLYAVFRVPVPEYMGAAGRGSITQSDLRRALGVSAPTVSRMVKSLEALGFVKRCPSLRDRRTLDISLTDFGWRRVRTMFLELFKWGVLGWALDCALSRAPAPINDEEIYRRREELYAITVRLRHAFRDRASLEYPNFDPDSVPSFWVAREPRGASS